MNEPRQKTIGVTPKEKERLDRAKRLYEEQTGDRADWGRFLGTATALGLAALGIYKLVNSSTKNPTTMCAVCGEKFSIAYAADLPPVVDVTCPHCGAELIVQFSKH